MIMITILPKKD